MTKDQKRKRLVEVTNILRPPISQNKSLKDSEKRKLIKEWVILTESFSIKEVTLIVGEAIDKSIREEPLLQGSN
jgi:hypothetical protein